MTLEEIIKEKIRNEGALSIAEYMQMALYHPQLGYYTMGHPIGSGGDFITAPEISQVFGELIGLWCADIWGQMGGAPIALVELGPGRGTLMQDALRATRMMPEFHEHMSVHLVETSPMLQSEQYHALRGSHERIEWHESVETLPDIPMIVIANEFFDALPIRQHVRTAQGICERKVGINPESGALEFILAPQKLSLAKSDHDVAEGTVIESCQLAKEIMGLLSEKIAAQGGALLMIDYGYLGEAHRDTLQALKNHAIHPVLKEAGKADITAHVDFSSLLEVAESHQLRTHGTVEQGKFLVRLGVEIRVQRLLANASETEGWELISGVKRLIDPAQMGDLFKVAAVLSDHDILPAGFYAHRE